MVVSTFQNADANTQTVTAWFGSVDGDIPVLARIGDIFAPHAQATPDMTVALDPGHVFDGVTLTEIAAQSTGGIAAPTVNARIDRVVVDQLSGVVSVVTGIEAASPMAPAIPAGKAPVAQISLQIGSTAITNDMITDERDLTSLGRIIAVEAGTGLTGGGTAGVVTIGLETPVPVALGGTGTATAGANKVFAGPASGADAAPLFRSLGLADLPADVATTEELNQAVTTINQAITSAIPPGAVQHFAMATAPSGWLAANGSEISRTIYAALFAAIGITFGAGNGSTTFNLPDLRGEFVRGWDNGRGYDSGRSFGSYQADAFALHSHLLTDFGHAHGTSDPGHLHGPSGGDSFDMNQSDYIGFAPGENQLSNTHPVGTTGWAVTGISVNSAATGISLAATGGSETRGKNLALLACIKY